MDPSFQDMVLNYQTMHYFINLTDVPDAEGKPTLNLTYSMVVPIEGNFNAPLWIQWFSRNWTNVFWLAGMYIITVFGLQIWMETRQKFDLRKPLFVWNVLLAVFSAWGAARSVPELTNIIQELGLRASFCLCGDRFLDNRVGGFWNWMFTLSKVPELGDTVFIVLRKQPLIFLHWYHHVTVLLYAWYSYSDYIATARWFVCMNYLVHSVMYSYYALKALKFKVSRFIAMFITTAQLAQMVMGAAVNIWAYQVKQAGNECHVSYENIKISLIMYTSYFVLFAHFFRRAYMKKPAALADQTYSKNGHANAITYDYDKSRNGKFD